MQIRQCIVSKEKYNIDDLLTNNTKCVFIGNIIVFKEILKKGKFKYLYKIAIDNHNLITIKLKKDYILYDGFKKNKKCIFIPYNKYNILTIYLDNFNMKYGSVKNVEISNSYLYYHFFDIN